MTKTTDEETDLRWMLRQRGRVIDPRVGRQITAMRRAVIAQERERCAKVADEFVEMYECMKKRDYIDNARMLDAKAIAAAIRGGG